MIISLLNYTYNWRNNCICATNSELCNETGGMWLQYLSHLHDTLTVSLQIESRYNCLAQMSCNCHPVWEHCVPYQNTTTSYLNSSMSDWARIKLHPPDHRQLYTNRENTDMKEINTLGQGLTHLSFVSLSPPTAVRNVIHGFLGWPPTAPSLLQSSTMILISTSPTITTLYKPGWPSSN